MSVSVFSDDYYQSGKIKNITATTGGLMLMMDSGLPSNCEGTPFGWMLVEQKNTALISLILAVWAADKAAGTVYTSGRVNGSGYCLVNQFDPKN